MKTNWTVVARRICRAVEKGPFGALTVPMLKSGEEVLELFQRTLNGAVPSTARMCELSLEAVRMVGICAVALPDEVEQMLETADAQVRSLLKQYFALGLLLAAEA